MGLILILLAIIVSYSCGVLSLALLITIIAKDVHGYDYFGFVELDRTLPTRACPDICTT